MASRIEDYGLIGNMHTSALVSRSGSIDWLCGPRFDSDAFFAGLVGYDEHGSWSLRPTVAVRETRQRYRGETMILETDFLCDGGAVRVTDFMPVSKEGCEVVRLVEGLDGEVGMEMLLDVRFGYGAYLPWITKKEDGLGFVAGPDAVRLRAPVAFDVKAGRASAYMTVRKGDRMPFHLAWHPSHQAPGPALDIEAELSRTESFWREWAGRCAYQGRWRDAVLRSLLVLKALIYAPTGGVVAAPTTSLPEAMGGVRNWDYRFCWLRDASLTIDALIIGGYLDEATAFRDWVLRVAAGNPEDVQIMYDVAGARRLTEFELGWLPGYEGSRPVRVGNAASNQFQLDVFGELLSAFYASRKMGMPPAAEDVRGSFEILVGHVERVWQQPDDGIWEVRGGRRHFTHSKVMAWVAIDRATRAIEDFGMAGGEGQKMLPHLRGLRERIHNEICERGFNPRVGAFTQSYGSDLMDASVLLIPHYGFLPGEDPRVKGTVAAVEKTLLRDGFVLRYATEHGTDGLPGVEGAFLACSFWLADNYAFTGRMEEAEELFGRLLDLRNHLGLLAEEYDPQLQRQVGNFPQAFSHLALIASARLLDAMSRHAGAEAPLRASAATPTKSSS
jgi:GH15 family glucan-1,4-alpha-glucosidase